MVSINKSINKRKSWSKEVVEQALQEYEHGANISTVSEAHGMSTNTLRRFINKSDLPPEVKHRIPRTMSLEEEAVFVEWLKILAANDVYIATKQIGILVDKVLEAQGRTSRFQGKNRGHDWYKDLMNRHLDLKSMIIWNIWRKCTIYNIDDLVSSYLSYIGCEKQQSRKGDTAEAERSFSDETGSNERAEVIVLEQDSKYPAEVTEAAASHAAENNSPSSYFVFVRPRVITDNKFRLKSKQSIQTHTKVASSSSSRKSSCKSRKHRKLKPAYTPEAIASASSLVSEGIDKMEECLQEDQLNTFHRYQRGRKEINSDPLFLAWKCLHRFKKELPKNKTKSSERRKCKVSNSQEICNKQAVSTATVSLPMSVSTTSTQSDPSIKLHISLNFASPAAKYSDNDFCAAEPAGQGGNAQVEEVATDDLRSLQVDEIAREGKEEAHTGRPKRKRKPSRKAACSSPVKRKK